MRTSSPASSASCGDRSAQFIKKADARFNQHLEQLEAQFIRKVKVAMATTLKEELERLPSVRREKSEKRAADLVAEEMTLQELLRAHKLTQEKIAQLLKIDQANVSRLEKRSDLMLSTLRDYVMAMGGELQLVAKFPNCPPVTLAGIGEIEEPEETSPSVPPERSSR